MKKLLMLSLLAGLSFSTTVSAEGWFDSIKNALGFGEESTEVEQPTAAGLVSSLTESLGITSDQAQGGMASLLNFAKNNADSETFSSLKSQIPGLDGLMSSLPDTSASGKEGLVGGLLDKASEYSDSLGAINDLKNQFESLGLDTQMITSFIQQANSYLDTEQGQKAKALLTQSLSGLSI